MPGEFDKPLRILIAEDTRLFTQALKDVLEEDRGIVVAGMACNGQEAVEKAKKLKPDLIIMDINMPVMSGMEAIEEIMATNPTPILVVTASASQRVLFQALEHGALDLVLKQKVWPSGEKEQAEFRKKVAETGNRQAEEANHAIHIVAPLREFLTDDTALLIDGGSGTIYRVDALEHQPNRISVTREPLDLFTFFPPSSPDPALQRFILVPVFAGDGGGPNSVANQTPLPEKRRLHPPGAARSRPRRCG